MAEAATVFSDLHVLDLSTRLSGAFCARQFADFGAEVLLAEPPEGHPLRHEPPFMARTEPPLSLLHAYANAGKRFATLQPNDEAELDRLLRWANIVITTDAQADTARYAEVNPRLIHVSVTPYGRTGPLAGAPGNDLTAYARTGWAMISGDPDQPPLKGSSNQVGYLTGVLAFDAAAAAVFHRDRTGEGQYIDVSELEALELITGPAMLTASYEGKVTRRHRPDMVRGPVAARDGYISLTISRAGFWRDAMNLLGLPELAMDERYSQARFRRQERDSYSPIAETRIRQWGRWEIFDALAQLRCVIGVVTDARDVVKNSHLAARRFFVDTEIAPGRRVPFPGAAFRMSDTPWREASRGENLSGTPDNASAALPVGRGLQSTTPVRAAEPTGTAPTRHSPTAAHPPLTGIRAVVLTQAWSGTFATELLGLLGADVIQIEARARPDSWRGDYAGVVPTAIRDTSRRQRPWNTSGLYNAVNLNKRAITLDFRDPRGLELFKQLVLTADVVAENFTPRVMGNLGLAYEALRQMKPDIILASLSAYGADGPYANIPGIGGTIEPMSGMSSLLGYEGGRPQNSGQMYPDPVSGAYFAGAMIMALRHRERTGRGQYIDLGMMEATVTFIGDALLEYAANGTVRRPLGNHHQRIAPHNIYPAKDGRWLALAAEDDTAWHRLVGHIGKADLLDDPRFSSMAARKANEGALDETIAAWTREQDAACTAEALLALGVTTAAVVDPIEALDDAQLRARDFFTAVDHPEVGRHSVPGVPWQFSRTPAAVTRAAPMLGEHTREVLAELLGTTNAEYEALVAAGVSGDMPPE